ncbi:MAG: carbohydrate ABC transporter permease [Phycisphaerae bacterium]|nr:carbohydrate ABC transporter permease [Phycisphaerae bacterium]
MKASLQQKTRSIHTIQRTRSITIHIIIGIVALLTILPPLIIVSGSFSTSDALIERGYRPWPQQLSVAGYSFVTKDPDQLLQSYLVSIIVSASGTLGGLSLTAMFSFALARKNFTLRKILILIVFFTLLFRAGLVPFYILMVRTLSLKNTLLSIILPGLINPWYILLLRAFFLRLPTDYYDAAKIDGAGEFTIFTRIAAPLAKPALATIGMFYVLGYWNDWFTPLLFIQSPELTPLQYLLHRMLANVVFLQQNMQNLSASDIVAMPTHSLRMAMAVLAAGPMTLVFLFFQRYFISGLTLGGIKG